MLRIIFLTTQLLYPGKSGGTIVSRCSFDTFYNNGFDIHLFFFCNENDKIFLKQFLSEYGSVKIYLFNNYNNSRNIKNLVKSLFYQKPLNIFRNYSKILEKKLNDFIISNEIDFIFCDHLEMFQFIPRSCYKKTILYEHNAEYMIWRKYSKILRNPILKLAILFESLRYKKYEISNCSKAGMVLAAPNDLILLGKNENNKERFQETYHLGNDSLLLLPPLKKNKKKIHVLFIGSMTWQANIDAVKWFNKKVLPILVKRYPDIIFDVVGKWKNGDEMAKNKNPNVIYHGFVDDIEPFFQESIAFVCPLQFGSGMKIKNIEALYRGIPLVTTSIGAESIELVNGENAFIADEPKKFAKYIEILISSDTIWSRLSQESRKLAKEKYTKNDAKKRLLRQIKYFFNA